MELDTLPKLLQRNFQRMPDRVAIRDKEFGIWNEHTWQESFINTKYFSLGMLDLGLQKGERAAIIGDNEPQLFWAQWGIQAAGGTALVMFTDAIGPEIEYLVNHSDSKFIVVRDQEQVDKILTILDKLPNVQKIIYWYPKGMKKYEHSSLMRYEEVLELGKKFEASHPETFENNVAQGQGNDIANFFYTSGTTGLPKGGRLTHLGLIKNTKKILELYPLTEQDDILCYLPPAWFAEPVYGSVPHLLTGAKLNIPEEPETVFSDIREICPVMILGGPKQWEGWVAQIAARMEEAGWLEKLVYRIFMPVALKKATAVMERKKLNPLYKVLWPIGNVLLFRPIRNLLGFKRARFCGTGAFVLAPESFAFLTGLGLNMMQGYGSTEGGLVTAHRIDDIRPDTCGTPLSGVDMKISEEGEVIWKSDLVFAGYHKNPEATQKAIRNGWFHSGDAGFINEDGHLVFLDRLSEMGELKGGIKYAPQYIESSLRFSHYIRDGAAIGDTDHDFIVVIINMNFENVGRWAEKNRLAYTTFTDLSQRLEVGELLRRDIDRVNRKLPANTRIKRYALLHKEFDPDEAELTRSRKLKRGAFAQRYRPLVEAMFAGKKSFPVESEFTYEDGRKGKITAEVVIYDVL